MTDNYSPKSIFLTWVLDGDALLAGGSFADENLRKVIELTSDDDRSNRDWATFILANLDLDTPVLRTALIAGAHDPDEDVRAEAIQGLARRDATLALPFLQAALAASSARVGIFEAAAIVAHPSLVNALTTFAERNRNDTFVSDALAACKAGIPNERYR